MQGTSKVSWAAQEWVSTALGNPLAALAATAGEHKCPCHFLHCSYVLFKTVMPILMCAWKSDRLEPD
jgi:hypothetical protein